MAGQEFIQSAAADFATSGGETLTANASTELVQPNSSRAQLVISATTADIWVSYSAPAAVGKGINVVAGGDPLRESDWKGGVWAISTGAAVVGWTETSYNVGDDEGEENSGAETFIPSGPSDGHPWTDVPEYELPGPDE